MRNNFFYILIICAYTDSLAKNEKTKPPGKDTFKLTREYFEEEAKTDIESLLSNIKNRLESEEDEDDTPTMNIYAQRNVNEQKEKLMEKFNEIMKMTNTSVKRLRSNYQPDDDNLNPSEKISPGGDLMKSLPLNFRDVIKSRSNVLKSDSNTRLQQLMNKLASSHSNSVRNRISVGDYVKYPNQNSVLRNHVHHVDIKPEVYPTLLPPEDKYGYKYGYKYGLKKDASEEDIQFGDLYYPNGEDESTKGVNKFDTKHKNKPEKNETVMRTTDESMSESLSQLNELLNHLHINHGKFIPTRKESENILHEFVKKGYAKSVDYLRTGNGLENNKNHMEELKNETDSKDKDKRNTNITMLRTDLSHKMNSDINEFMKYLDIGRNLRTSHNPVTYRKRPIRTSSPKVLQRGSESRMKRSTITQAGYTQDPDTCKTYNENLIKFWSNLSKYINVTEQPNERALHNIAIMIQAYLEHQNAKQPPETYKVKHEGSRDKIGEVLIKIKKILDESEGSVGKITYIITKYLKPFYGDVENADCQQVNEEFLSSSVELLYKNYLENAECHSDGISAVRKKELSVRKPTVKTEKAPSSVGHTTLSLANIDYKPEVQTIIIEDELYSDYHKGKTQRQRPTTKFRRVFKQNRKQRSRPAVLRSGNQNGSEKLKIRSKASPKSANRKLKKSSLKSDLAKGRCDRFATRKFIVSLRSVIERYMGLLECQLDNTLRSVNYGRVSKNPHYLYASKFYSSEDNRRHRKILPRVKLTRKNTGRSKNKSLRKLQKKQYHDTSDENDQDVFVRDNESSSTWVKKYSLDQITGMNSDPPVITSDTDARGSNTNNDNQNSNSDHLTTYNEYFQSPPLYDDYDGIYKTQHLIDSNGFPSIMDPLFTLNDKKTTEDKSDNKKSALSDKEQANENVRNNEYDIFYEEDLSEEPNYILNISDQQTDTDKEVPFIDLTKLRNDDHLIEANSKTHVKSFESITEFLKRARDASLQTPEIAVPFALDTNKGYVELTHLVKYPKILVYRPQFLVKNTMPYDDFLKTISNFNMTNDEVRLMKIVRHLPDSSVKVLFETEDFESPLEVRNLNDNIRRSGSLDPAVNYQLENIIDRVNENANVGFMDVSSNGFDPINRNEVHSNFVDTFVKSDISGSDEDISASNLDFDSDADIWRHIQEVSPNLDFNTDSDTIRHITELSPKLSYNSDLNTLRQKEELFSNLDFDSNSDTNTTSNSKPNSLADSSSSLEFSALPSLAPGIPSTIPGLGSGKNLGSPVDSVTGSQIGSSIGTGLDTALSLNSAIKLNPMHPSHISSYLSKWLPSYFNSQFISNPSLNSQSHISHSDSPSSSHSLFNSYFQLNPHLASLSNSNSGSHSLLPSTASSNVEVGNFFPSSTQSTLLQWWKKWKNIIKGKIKTIIGKMASFSDSIDNIINL